MYFNNGTYLVDWESTDVTVTVDQQIDRHHRHRFLSLPLDTRVHLDHPNHPQPYLIIKIDPSQRVSLRQGPVQVVSPTLVDFKWGLCVWWISSNLSPLENRNIFRDRPRSAQGTPAKSGRVSRRPGVEQPWPSAAENLSSCPSKTSAGMTGSWLRPVFTPSTVVDRVVLWQHRPAAPIHTHRSFR